jgi:xylulokinase
LTALRDIRDLKENGDMPESIAVLAHDFGTTGNKATLFTPEGELLASHYLPYQTEYPNPGWAEQNPDDWKRAFIGSTEAVLSRAGIQARDLLAVTFSAHMLGCIPVAKDGRVLRNRVLLWADHRSVAQAEIIRERIGWEAFYRRTGGGLELALYPAAKLLWLKENEPDVYRRAHLFLGTKDLLVHWLTGRFVTDYSDASNTGLLDLAERRWAEDYIEVLGLAPGRLPEEILPSIEIVGRVTREAARATGLTEGTPVVLGGGDVPCAAVGAGVVAEGTGYNYIGSASWVAAAAPQGVFDLEMRPFTLCHLVPGMYVSQLATYSAGVVHEWFKDNIWVSETREQERDGASPFDLMNKAIARAPAGANGLLFLPHMRGGGAPFHDLDVRGALLGLELGHTRADVLRAVLEGISLNIGLLCEALEQGAGSPFEELRVIGGGAKSRVWLEILASALEKRVVTLTVSQEANCLGAAMTAYVALGQYDGFAQAAESMIGIAARVDPDPSCVPIYRARSELFRAAYERVAPIHKALAGRAE